MKKQLVIWGAGGHATVIADAARASGSFDVVGYLDEVDPKRAGERFAGSNILGGIEALATLSHGAEVYVVPGVGNPAARLRMLTTIAEYHLWLATVMHPASVVSQDAAIGEGSFVAAGAIVSPYSKIGRGVILNTACSVDHHCEIADGVHIAPGARLAGSVKVGECAWIGIGAVVRDEITIGINAIVGAGAVVVHDVADDIVVVGNPARFLKNTPRAANPT